MSKLLDDLMKSEERRQLGEGSDINSSSASEPMAASDRPRWVLLTLAACLALVATWAVWQLRNSDATGGAAGHSARANASPPGAAADMAFAGPGEQINDEAPASNTPAARRTPEDRLPSDTRDSLSTLLQSPSDSQQQEPPKPRARKLFKESRSPTTLREALPPSTFNESLAPYDFDESDTPYTFNQSTAPNTFNESGATYAFNDSGTRNTFEEARPPVTQYNAAPASSAPAVRWTPVETLPSEAADLRSDKLEPTAGWQQQEPPKASLRESSRASAAARPAVTQRAMPEQAAPGSAQPEFAATTDQPAQSQLPDGETLSFWELPQAVRDVLPELRITVLAYAERPEDRFLLMGGQRVEERQQSQDGLLLEEIRRDGAVFRYRNYRFLVKALQFEWWYRDGFVARTANLTLHDDR